MTKKNEAAEQQEQQTEDVAQTTEASQEQQKEMVKVNTKKGLRLRVGPGVDFSILKILPDGTLAEVLTLPDGVEVPGWALITADGQHGWVKVEFLISAE